MAAISEKERERLVTLRRQIGSQVEVGELVERHKSTISRFESKGAEVPLWYRVVIEELCRRKKLGLLITEGRSRPRS